MATVVDTRGKLCPLPLIMFRKALNEHPEETTFSILTDNETSCGNLKDFIQDHKFGYTEERDEQQHTTILTVQVAGGTPMAAPQVATLQTHQETPKSGATIQISSDSMGHGSEELGHILALSFLNALLGSELLPKEIICYNSGVKLAMKGTPTAEKLQELVDKGVHLILCGTCVDYFGIKEQIAVGHITNMLAIYEHLAQATLVIKP